MYHRGISSTAAPPSLPRSGFCKLCLGGGVPDCAGKGVVKFTPLAQIESEELLLIVALSNRYYLMISTMCFIQGLTLTLRPLFLTATQASGAADQTWFFPAISGHQYDRWD